MEVNALLNAGYDYVVVGSLGFYQAGQGTPRHQHIEKKVLLTICKEEPWLRNPEIEKHCNLEMVKFPHEFGTYEELCVTIKKDVLNSFDDKQVDAFYHFVNKIQQYISSSTEKMLKLCKEMWGSSMDVVHYKPVLLYQQYRNLKVI